MDDTEQKQQENLGSENVEKQQENNEEEKKLTGFQLNPQNINKNGRPPKGWSWAELLEDIGEEVMEGDPNKRTFKQVVGRRLWLECAKGNVHAIRELFNRMEGLPRMKMEVDGKVDTRIPELIEILDRIVSAQEVDENGQPVKVNQATNVAGDKGNSQENI